MAMVVRARCVGVDVAKEFVEVAEGEAVRRVANTPAAIRRWLGTLSGPLQLAVESTQRYHEAVVHAALARGHRVYLVDAYRLSRYREALGVRAKSDAADARLLWRYLQAEGERLRPYELAPRAVTRLRELLHARAKLTAAKVTIAQSLAAVGALARTRQALLTRLQGALALIDRKLAACLKEAGYSADARRTARIPGIGPLSSAALVASFHRGRFLSADAFIAYLGLDLRVRESGRWRGQRKLSKRGDPEVRRLLFNAARAAARTAQWRDYYERLRARGLATTAAYVALSRKLARLAFALLRDQSEFRPYRPA